MRYLPGSKGKIQAKRELKNIATAFNLVVA